VVTATPKIVRDVDTGASKGFGFVSYDSFEASDAAIDAMNGQVRPCAFPKSDAPPVLPLTHL
jgi:hypothetical protein